MCRRAPVRRVLPRQVSAGQHPADENAGASRDGARQRGYDLTAGVLLIVLLGGRLGMAFSPDGMTPLLAMIGAL